MTYLAAQNAAHKVTGVSDVVKELVFKVPNTVRDQELARAVRDALEWSVLVPDERSYQRFPMAGSGWKKMLTTFRIDRTPSGPL